MSRRQPILPKSEKAWTEDANGYRKAFHEDIYPKGQAWTPVTGMISAASITGSYVRSGRISVFSVVMDGVTVSSGGYFDLPFAVSQAAVFSVSDGTTNRPGTIEAGGSRVYLTAFSAGRVIISGVVVS